MYILYFIPSIASCLGRSVIAHPYIYMYILYVLIPSLYLDLCVLGSCCGIVRCYLLDIATLSELEAQAFRYTAITSAHHVYVTNNI